MTKKPEGKISLTKLHGRMDLLPEKSFSNWGVCMTSLADTDIKEMPSSSALFCTGKGKHIIRTFFVELLSFDGVDVRKDQIEMPL